METEEAARLTGFSLCDFTPSKSEWCEECLSDHLSKIWYRRTDPFSSDGQYYCCECVKKEAEENARYAKTCIDKDW